MAKMNLDFLLSPEGSNDRNDRSSRADSPLSLDYIAPSTSPDDKHRRHHHHRRTTEPHIPSRHHHHASSSSKSPSAKDSPHTASRPHHFKSKKATKSPASPNALSKPSSAEVKPHVCRSCDRSFYKLEQLKRHDRLVHLNLRPFVCSTCDLSFGTKQNMQVHLTTRKHRHRLETLQSNLQSGHGSSSRKHR